MMLWLLLEHSCLLWLCRRRRSGSNPRSGGNRRRPGKERGWVGVFQVPMPLKNFQLRIFRCHSSWYKIYPSLPGGHARSRGIVSFTRQDYARPSTACELALLSLSDFRHREIKTDNGHVCALCVLCARTPSEVHRRDDSLVSAWPSQQRNELPDNPKPSNVIIRAQPPGQN